MKFVSSFEKIKFIFDDGHSSPLSCTWFTTLDKGIGLPQPLSVFSTFQIFTSKFPLFGKFGIGLYEPKYNVFPFAVINGVSSLSVENSDILGVVQLPFS